MELSAEREQEIMERVLPAVESWKEQRTLDLKSLCIDLYFQGLLDGANDAVQVAIKSSGEADIKLDKPSNYDKGHK